MKKLMKLIINKKDREKKKKIKEYDKNIKIMFYIGVYYVHHAE
jgi:hypothetical protein